MAKEDTFETLIEDSSEEIKEICIAIRNVILDVHPDAVEVVRMGYRSASFGLGAKKMSDEYAYIMPHNNHVNLGFNHGAMLEDVDGLLEGTGKKMRHVKVKSVSAVPAFRTLIEAAVSERTAAA